MLCEEPEIRDLVRRIVWNLSRDPSVADDLMQEALIHLWRAEQDRPQQTLSWYLQGCQFRLSNYLGAGRSVDSRKRWKALVFAAALEGESNPMDELESSYGLPSELVADDLAELLAGRLTGREKPVLDLLLEGYGVREVARRLRVSHKTVIQRRRKIAMEAIKLGITPVRPLGGRVKDFTLVSPSRAPNLL